MDAPMPVYDFDRLRDPRDKRLANEHMLLHEFCSKTDRIRYEIVGDRMPPEKYMVYYYVKSIIGINPEDHSPIYGDLHEVEISFPTGFPIEAAKIYAKTDLWHPNIKWSGRFKGRVCGNLEDFGPLYTLDLLVRRIGEILQYKNYHAIKEVQPYPEDFEVADWVLATGEKNGYMDKSKGIVVDPRNLVWKEGDPEEVYQPPLADTPPQEAPEDTTDSIPLSTSDTPVGKTEPEKEPDPISPPKNTGRKSISINPRKTTNSSESSSDTASDSGEDTPPKSNKGGIKIIRKR